MELCEVTGSELASQKTSLVFSVSGGLANSLNFIFRTRLHCDGSDFNYDLMSVYESIQLGGCSMSAAATFVFLSSNSYRYCVISLIHNALFVLGRLFSVAFG